MATFYIFEMHLIDYWQNVSESTKRGGTENRMRVGSQKGNPVIMKQEYWPVVGWIPPRAGKIKIKMCLEKVDTNCPTQVQVSV